ncbi:glycosyltransferase family 76 protein [Hydnum rufescens UP504]|uniref:GPI mannosyltransferase 2 n=1 Tax=Hydnum rufescens UP504 TaxID=1448309 RepID=A0A9P6DWK1_9AGAM|nr:glycosyltransferase family 76 protein [Hydnum rufescens UP504]
MQLFDVRSHRVVILNTAIASRIATGLLIYTSTYFSLFDASPLVIVAALESSLMRWASSHLRWDAFHFTHIAQRGYVFEYEFAFFPGVPIIMRSMAEFGAVLGLARWSLVPNLSQLIIGGALAAMALDSSMDLYSLTLFHTKSAHFALLATLMSLIPSSPAVLMHGAYSEPFFAFFSFKGMLFCTKQNWLAAALCFAIATTFRANGLLLCGYLAWGIVVSPWLRENKIALKSFLFFVVMALISVVPFFLHQYYAYLSFCHNSSSRPEWCDRTVPFIYSYVQARYWDVGFLRYWEISQLPNFILGAPPLTLLIYTSSTHIFEAGLEIVHRKEKIQKLPSRLNFLSSHTLDILPYAIHALVLTLILLFASHTQIVLRLASSLPFTHWAAAALFIEKPRIGRIWVAWSVIWGTMSCILWGVFLPPA